MKINKEKWNKDTSGYCSQTCVSGCNVYRATPISSATIWWDRRHL